MSDAVDEAMEDDAEGEGEEVESDKILKEVLDEIGLGVNESVSRIYVYDGHFYKGRKCRTWRDRAFLDSRLQITRFRDLSSIQSSQPNPVLTISETVDLRSNGQPAVQRSTSKWQSSRRRGITFDHRPAICWR